TAVGKYPVEAVITLDKVARTTEAASSSGGYRGRKGDLEVSISTAISHAAASIVADCEVDVIVTMTHSGITARGVSRYRPMTRIVALSPLLSTCRALQLVWGIMPIHVEQMPNTDDMIVLAEKLLLNNNIVTKGDYFVLTAGIPIGQTGSTNLLKVQRVGYV
ncbi:MAG: pyruvate kinase, partial [Candidatus Marinimicrobia bacterium]|nr:pyruvate kinase [Candidatus Neomarinimicrobiota bacterium]